MVECVYLDNSLKELAEKFKMDNLVVTRTGRYSCTNSKGNYNVLGVELDSAKGLIKFMNDLFKEEYLEVDGLVISGDDRYFNITINMYNYDDMNNYDFSIYINRNTLVLEDSLIDLKSDTISYSYSYVWDYINNRKDYFIGKKELISDYLINIIESLSNVDILVDRVEFSLLNHTGIFKYRSSFDNDKRVVNGLSYICESNGFKDVKESEKYALCVLF